MTFFSPWSLAWLGLLVPIIVFFYLLKLKRKEAVVSSVLLWSHLVKDMQANSPFQKLRKNLLLLLQLLIALLAIVGLARPALVVPSLGGNQVVVILDGSASMKSRDVNGRSRFDAARDVARQMISRMRGGDRLMLLLATSRTHRLTPFTRDRNQLRRALDAARAADTGAHLRDALLLAASLS
ncbi:MAG: VWA domain-containing protein, partial [Armatimonadetes bacterium]|nr:VWA domain-containing protein [Armatimonadota bacterium]